MKRLAPEAGFDQATMAELERQLHTLDSNQLKAALKKLVPEYTPHLD